jgi:predicted permease
VFNYLWAQHYGRDGAAVAGVVVISTALAFVLLPLILAVALRG